MTEETLSTSQNELKSILEEVNTYKTQLTENPGSVEFSASYFWSLHKEGKFRIEHQDLQRAIICLREMLHIRNAASEEEILALGWMIFHILKSFAADEYLRKQFTAAIPELIHSYIDLKIPVPSQLHSSLLGMANKLAVEPSEWFLTLLKAYGLNSFQDGDFEEYHKEGKKHNSLAEMILVKTAKFIEKEQNEENLNWLLSHVEKFITRMPGNHLLAYYHGRLLMRLYRGKEAKECLHEVLLKQKNQFWAWAAYGETLKEADKTNYLACLCKALSFPVDEHMLLSVREEMATLLVELEMYPEAKTEIEQILQIRHEHNYKLCKEIEDLQSKQWFIETIAPKNNLNFYLKYLKQADKLLYENKEPVNGIVTAIYEENKGAFIQFDLDKVALYKFPKSTQQKNPFSIGSLVKVAVEAITINGQRRYTALRAEDSTEFPTDTFFRKFNGDLKVPQKTDSQPFGFVEDIFVPCELIKKVPGITKVMGIAIKEFNKKRNQYGWRALGIQAQPAPVEEPAQQEIVPVAQPVAEAVPVSPEIVPTIEEPVTPVQPLIAEAPDPMQQQTANSNSELYEVSPAEEAKELAQPKSDESPTGIATETPEII